MTLTRTILRDPSFDVHRGTYRADDWKVTAAVLTRDEERTIYRCIEGLLKTDVDAILVLDTGSADRTVEIVTGFSDPRITLHETRWNNSFARARNEAMDRIGRGWVFFVDADEWIEDDSYPSLKDELRDAIGDEEVSCVFAPLIRERHTDVAYLDVPRIASVRHVRFAGNVHEYPYLLERPQLLPGVVGLDITLWHDGYAPAVLASKDKVARNLALLEESLLEDPHNPRTMYYKLRDGAYIYDAQQVVELVAAFDAPLALAIADPHSAEEYVERAKVCACDRLSSLGAWSDTMALCTELDAGPLGVHPDAEYFRHVMELNDGVSDPSLLLRLVKLRRNTEFVARSSLDPTGRPLDALIAAHLFRLRGADDANAFLATCEPWTDQFFDQSRWRLLARWPPTTGWGGHQRRN